MAGSSKNSWDLNPIMEAFSKVLEGRPTDENFDELDLRVKDLNEILKGLKEFLKSQELLSKDLSKTIKEAVDLEKTQTKSKKGPGITQDTALLYLSNEISKKFALSARGKSEAFDVNKDNPLTQAMKENLSAYEKLTAAIYELQKRMADYANTPGGKLKQTTDPSSGKDPSGKGFFGQFSKFLGLGSKKDSDIKDATPQSNGFAKGIGTLIGFLGSRGSGFLGKLGALLGEFAQKTGIDALKLAVYGIFSIFRTFGGKEGIRNAVKLIVKSLLPGGLAAVLGGKVASKLAQSKIGQATIKSVAGKLAKKVGGKQASKAVGKLASKVLSKEGGKVAGKLALKATGGKIPGLSLLTGAGFAADRLIRDKDWKGAGLELASGVAASLPGAGTAASVGIDATLIARDIKRASEKAATINREGFEGIQDQAKKQEEAESKKLGILEWFKKWWPNFDGLKDKIKNLINKDGAGKGDTGFVAKSVYELPVGKPITSKTRDDFIKTEVKRLLDAREAGDPNYKDKSNRELAQLANEAVLGTLERHQNAVIDNPSGSAGGSTSSVGGSAGAFVTPTNGSFSGSQLGDAFLGGNYAKVSAGGGFHAVRSSGKTHKGIDLPYPEGTDVRAFLGGTVVKAGWSSGFGNTVGILNRGRDGKTWTNIYGHLSAINVKVGDEIQRGQLIGKSGHTGFSVTGSKPGSKVGSHLHFEVRPTMTPGGSIDPVGYVSGMLGYSAGTSLSQASDTLGYSTGSVPESSDLNGITSGDELSSARAVSEPKGIPGDSGSSGEVASAEGSSITQDLKNAYANNQFDQTGNVQFLAAINSIRVQLGKFQQIGMVV